MKSVCSTAAGLWRAAAGGARAALVEYAFDIDPISVQFSGKPAQALAVGGRIPAPTIEAAVGDTLRVTFHNRLDEESSVHWHGILLPNDQDGVPWLTTQPIAPGTSFTYQYKVTHAGTYWYHSHSGLQEQRGVYGALIFHPQKEAVAADRDYAVVLSDWTDEAPAQVLRNLKKDGDYYARKKNTVQSWAGVMARGWPAVKNRLHGAWIRRGPMDPSDVGYDLFLANGKPEQTLAADAGERVRLRLINAAASSSFDVEFAGGPMTVVAADGADVEPQKVPRLRIAIPEPSAVVVEIPQRRAYALRATSVAGAGYSNTFIGAGERVQAPDIPAPDWYRMSHGMHGAHDMHDMQDTQDMRGAHDTHDAHDTHKAHKAHSAQDMQDAHNAQNRHDADAHDTHDMHSAHDAGAHDTHDMHAHHRQAGGGAVVAHLTDYSMLRAKNRTALPAGAPEREVRLKLTGNMERYVWAFNDKTLSESDSIRIRKGENTRLVLENETMMNHPLHLHGHFFRVLNGQGEYSPLKHTVNVPPMGTTVIEFEAKEDKDWFFHCHNLYHMHTGMARVLSYEGSSSYNDDTKGKIAHGNAWYFAGNAAVLGQMAAGRLRAANLRNAFVVHYDYDYDKSYDADFLYRRNFSRFLDAYIGAELEREDGHEDPEKHAVIGLHYTLPLLIDADLRLDSDNKASLELKSAMQLTSRLMLEWQYEFKDDDEYRAGLSWELSKALSLTALYDSDYKGGAGLKWMF